ncbi:membrane hypothetical protein [Gammaproteobacteria bacterium]
MNNHSNESVPKNAEVCNEPVKDEKTTADYFFIPVWKLALLSIFTCGIYSLYWQYKNWVVIKRSESTKIWPFWRALFSFFFCYSLFKKILLSVKPQKYKILYSPGLLATIYMVLCFGDTIRKIISRYHGTNLDPRLTFWCCFILMLTILLVIQKAINFNYEHVKRTMGLKHKLSIKEKIFLVVVSLILFPLVIIGSLPHKTKKPFIIKAVVAYTKFKHDLPIKISDELKLVDITARPDAVRYHYFVSKNIYFDSPSINKKIIVDKVCNDTGIKDTLDYGINLEYSYMTEDAHKEYVVTINKNDCKR